MACDVCGRIGETEYANERLRSACVVQVCRVCEKKYTRMLHKYCGLAWKRVARKMKKQSQITRGE